jgi:L-alanine-DL-glutamate epimerase-like enolase superfamily enzyme
MKIESLSMRSLCIPFHEAFRHSSAERSETQSVLVTARDSAGLEGYGESCPRSYVTNENPRTVNEFFQAHCASIQEEIGSLDALRTWIESHASVIDANPAAWCAIELALLDLLARSEDRSVEGLLGIPADHSGFRYSAVIGDSDFRAFRKLVERYLAIGMTDFKLKVSGELKRDKPKIDLFRDLSDGCRVRLDGNNLWDEVDQAAAYLRALDFPLFAFEEPLARDQHAALAELASLSGLPIILDESFRRVEQLSELQAPSERFLLNLRVSKMGGILRSLRIVEAATQLGIRLIIGAQVGETTLLTRAALALAAKARPMLVAQEGAFGTLLLTQDPWQPSLRFGAAGVLDATAVGRLGFGLTPDPGLPRLLGDDHEALVRHSEAR